MTNSNVSRTSALWNTEDRSRWFLVPGDLPLAAGTLSIRSLTGDVGQADAEWLTPFEITEEQARRWAKDQLRQSLGELKGNIDDTLADLRQRLQDFKTRHVTDATTITPNAGGALFELLSALPGVIAQSLSTDEARVDTARKTMKDLQQRLKDSGIDLDDRFTRFPDRLADLRKNPDDKS